MPCWNGKLSDMETIRFVVPINQVQKGTSLGQHLSAQSEVSGHYLKNYDELTSNRQHYWMDPALPHAAAAELPINCQRIANDYTEF